MDYEQKYKHALERTKDLMTNQNPPAFDKDLISIVFPELKENEYEKMKFLIKSCVYASNITTEGREEIFTWLEKQKPIDEESLKKGALKYVANQFINWLDKEIPEGEMCLSNVECKIIEDAFLKEDWTSISRYMQEKLKKHSKQNVTNSFQTCKMETLMTLDDAIEDCKKKSCDNTLCSKEHKQFAEWLIELKGYLKGYHASVNQEA